MLYKYETHSHTSETSRCSGISGAKLAQYYKSIGYTGLFITDHYFNGNTTVPRDLDWKERVELFMAGYRAAKEEGDKIGLDVFFAWEYSYWGDDWLIYGLDEQWILDNPDQLKWGTSEYFNRVRADGGMVIHAHPFRESYYIDHIHLVPRQVDGVEIINASMTEEVNRRADWYADSYGLIKSAGSDNHSGRRDKMAGVYLPERVQDVQHFCRLMKEGKGEIFFDRYDKEGNRL